ncbi:MAG: transporter, partial [Desulfoferrobacter sp.]
MRVGEILEQKPWCHVLHLLFVIVFVSGTACTTLGPNFEKPQAPVSQKWIEQGNSKVKTVKDADYKDWWKVFDDPILNSLIQTAYKQNLDLQIAGTRILQARAALG